MVAAADQVVDRTAEGLANDVPAGGLDRGNGVHVDLAALGVKIARHALEDRFDLERIETFVPGGDFMNRGFNGFREAIDRAFTNSVEAIDWSVSSRTNSQFFHGLPTMQVDARVIFMPSPQTAGACRPFRGIVVWILDWGECFVRPSQPLSCARPARRVRLVARNPEVGRRGKGDRANKRLGTILVVKSTGKDGNGGSSTSARR